jgi:hypothetical protein
MPLGAKLGRHDRLLAVVERRRFLGGARREREQREGDQAKLGAHLAEEPSSPYEGVNRASEGSSSPMLAVM